jgi:hypothetical protein
MAKKKVFQPHPTKVYYVYPDIEILNGSVSEIKSRLDDLLVVDGERYDDGYITFEGEDCYLSVVLQKPKTESEIQQEIDEYYARIKDEKRQKQNTDDKRIEREKREYARLHKKYGNCDL